MKYHSGFGALPAAAAISLCMVLTAAAPALAQEKSYETEVINSISIGDISITLNDYETGDGGDRAEYRDHKYVVPGETVNKIVRITNLANPAWIRVKVEYIPDGRMKDFPASCITLGDEHWMQRGGYYYYTLPLESGAETDFMRELKIPYFWGDEAAGRDFELVITAEAVQEANFIPDFARDDPWFGTLIETCVHTCREPSLSLFSYGAFSISFEGGAEGLVRIGDDFFGNFGALMPGDTGRGTVIIRNGYSEPITLYFRTEGTDERPLAAEAQLTIYDGDSVIYDGKLSESREEVQIAWLGQGDEKELIYTIFIPSDCGNSYAVTKAADKWIFRAALNVAQEAPRHTSGGGGSGSKGGVAGAVGGSGGLPGPAAGFLPYIRELAQTGQGGALLCAAISMTLSGLLLILASVLYLHLRRSPGRGGE